MLALSAYPWILAAVADWLIIGLAMALAIHAQHPLAFVAAALVIGSRQHALAILGHDGAHRLICRNAEVNDALTCGLSFWPLMTGLEAYRLFHFNHHRWLGTDLDPELIDLDGWSSWEWRLPASPFKVGLLCLADCCGYGIYGVAKAGLLIGKLGFWDWAGPVVWWTFFAGWCIALGLWEVPALWFAGIATSFWACFRLRIWTEHRGADGGTHRFTPGLLARAVYLPHNTWLHWEHHVRPGVPFWRLPALRP